MGRNRPAEAMPFDGMVRRYFNNLLLPICELTHTRLLNTMLSRNWLASSGSTPKSLSIVHSSNTSFADLTTPNVVMSTRYFFLCQTMLLFLL